jgi:DNA-binding CsgD family transcriptional regulator
MTEFKRLADSKSAVWQRLHLTEKIIMLTLVNNASFKEIGDINYGADV